MGKRNDNLMNAYGQEKRNGFQSGRILGIPMGVSGVLKYPVYRFIFYTYQLLPVKTYNTTLFKCG